MCDTDDRAGVMAAEAWPADLEWKGEVLPLEPVDELSVLMVCDNVTDILLPDQGPAKRLPLAGMARAPMLEAPTILGGKAADVPLAQHGFSALVEVRKGSRVRRLLFDTGITPDGCAGNLRRLGQDLAGIEAIVCSHGHFDHTTGLSGLIARLGRANLPVLIHPEFWNRRRLAIPGGEPFELPTTSRRALDEAGFDVIEDPGPKIGPQLGARQLPAARSVVGRACVRLAGFGDWEDVGVEAGLDGFEDDPVASPFDGAGVAADLAADVRALLVVVGAEVGVFGFGVR
jgi:hypothetical protein